jgi:hypothetical protein
VAKCKNPLEALMTKYRVKATLIEPQLGTVPKDPKIYSEYIASKAPAPEKGTEEVGTVPVSEEKGWTGFHTDDDGPFIYEYMVRGFFKEACSSLSRNSKSKSSKVRAFKKIIDKNVRVEPRRIHFSKDGKPLDKAVVLDALERPIRIQNAKGEYVALTKSDMIPVGAVLEFEVHVLADPVTEDVLREWLALGAFSGGFGQWRSGGYGKFDCEVDKIEEDGKPKD